MGVAAPWVVFGAGGEASFDWVAVDVLDDFGHVFAGDVAVEVAGLPELVAGSFELAGGGLFEGFEELGEQDSGWLVDDEMDVLGHEDVGVDAGLMTGTGLLEVGLDEGFGLRCGEVGETVVTTEGDEVEGLGLLVSLEAVGHLGILGYPGWWECGSVPHSSRFFRDE